MILEAFFAGFYTSLTKGLFVVYLVSVQQKVNEISFIVFLSAVASLITGISIYKNPRFVPERLKVKLLAFHTLERAMWLLMPFARNTLHISLLYVFHVIFSSLVSIFLTFIIYSELTEDHVRKITAERSAANGVSSIMGYAVGIFLLAFLPDGREFDYIFPLGSAIGFISTFLLLFLSLSDLERHYFPPVITQPEKLFSTSLFFVTLTASSNFMGIIWTPYLMNCLNAPDFLTASMSLMGTLSSIIASLFWRNKSFRSLRLGLALNAAGPIIVWITPWPLLHPAINAYTSFTFAGANFLGIFLFARYKEIFGAVRSGILLTILGNSAQIISSILGYAVDGNFMLAFLITMLIKVTATILALSLIPEVSVVPEDAARTYSQLLYSQSLAGYRMSVEFSRETLLTIFRILSLLVVIATLYIIYRSLWIVIH